MSMKCLRLNVALVACLLIICCQFRLSNSRTSSRFRLNMSKGKITEGNALNDIYNDFEDLLSGDEIDFISYETTASISDVYAGDETFYIIASSSNNNNNNVAGKVAWIRHSTEDLLKSFSDDLRIDFENANKNIRNRRSARTAYEHKLNCGNPVNFTYYDYLIGVGQSFVHPLVPEPELAYFFLKSKNETAYKNFDIVGLERRLKKVKLARPRSVHTYIQIGNYFRIVGEAQKAIECFRRALSIAPTNSEVLLNLARVLYNLQFLDDAIHLTRRSLELQHPGESSWQQYFTLGEIFKSYGHFQESLLHLRHALELRPKHEPIIKALRDVENIPSSTIYVSTMVIIVILVVSVLAAFVYSTASCSILKIDMFNVLSPSADYSDHRTQRHFNRAMAMRSLKGLPTARGFKNRRN